METYTKLPARKVLDSIKIIQEKLREQEIEHIKEANRLALEIEKDEKFEKEWETRMILTESDMKDPIDKIFVRLEDLVERMKDKDENFDIVLDLFMRYFFVGFSKNLELLKDPNSSARFIEHLETILGVSVDQNKLIFTSGRPTVVIDESE